MLRVVDMGQMQLAELAAQLGDQSAFVRAALIRAGDGWALRTCEAIVGAEPPGWQLACWEYPSHAFIADVVPASSLLGAFRTDQSGEFAIGPFRASVAPTYDTVHWRHLPSRAVYDPVPLPWPTVDYEFSGLQTQAAGSPSGFLIGEGCPSFTDADTALRAFFHGDYSTIGAGRTTSRMALVRHVDQEAWIERVAIGVTHLDVVLRGNSVAGVEVEINSGSLRSRKTSGPRGRVRLRLPDGLPEDAWLFVTRGSRWLDYRPLGQQLPGAKGRVDRGVELVIPDDPDSRVAALIADGEGPRVEFKRELPRRDDESRRKSLKTVAAFANAAGGAIVFGIDPDEVTVMGVATDNEQTERDRLGELIHRILRPTPDFEVRWASASGVRVLMLEVAPGLAQPYGIQLRSDDHVEYYVRRGASTFPATQQEVREAAVRTAPNETPPSLAHYLGRGWS